MTAMHHQNLTNGHPGPALSLLPRESTNTLPEILFITSFPPRECGIATYSQDLVKALNHKFDQSFTLSICPVESESDRHIYPAQFNYLLNTSHPHHFDQLAARINASARIQLVVVQHEFGLFSQHEDSFRLFLQDLAKPVILALHTVLPAPSASMLLQVQQLSALSAAVVVMTQAAAGLLRTDYALPKSLISVIPHGTHLVPHLDKQALKEKYHLTGKKILSTFGLLSSGKSIETTLNAMPAIVASNLDVLFLIIGKTHPSVVNEEGEKYRRALEAKVAELGLKAHVKFINRFLPLPDLLEYLQLTDIYLFTSKDPNQAVSGTFAYALSCGCPIISTPIPHAKEVLGKDVGIIVDFGNSAQLAKATNRLLADDSLRKRMSSNCLHRMACTAWENAAIAHARLFASIIDDQTSLQYNLPVISTDHLKRMTTSFGMIQFANINQPSLASGYTLDDNARAMVAMCQHFELTRDEKDLIFIRIYLRFIRFCLQPNGSMLNYVDAARQFTDQNYTTNLEDANGRALWALGYLISMGSLLPTDLTASAGSIMWDAQLRATRVHSTRAMAFAIKGLYYRHTQNPMATGVKLIKELADRLVQMYRHEASPEWKWFEGYLTYANSILPEAMLCAWLATGDPVYCEIAQSSFDFLLSKIFRQDGIHVISNRGWLHRNQSVLEVGGEQPIDVAYTILALSKFYAVFGNKDYHTKMHVAFDWFLGNNHLHQIIYNPCTGGCYDGLEENNVNLNQGAESTVSYLMARLVMEKHFIAQIAPKVIAHRYQKEEAEPQDKMVY